MSRIARTLGSTALCLLVVSAAAKAQTKLTARARNVPPRPVSTVESDRTRDGLVGPVRRVRTEVAKLSTADGRLVESKHVMLEIVAYDLRGNKIENQYFPIAGSTPTGKEVYKYDQKGNISEMTLLDNDGSLLGREVYSYEFDFAGNWNKMTTSVAVINGGKVTFEPTEVTYRSIMYYLDENMVKMIQPNSAPTQPNAAPISQPSPANSAPASNASSASLAPKTQTPRNKKAESKQASPALPSVSESANALATSAPVDVKTLEPNAAQPVPLVTLDSEPPPSPAPKPTTLKPVSGGVLNGTALSLPSPTYPDAARRMRTVGLVAVEVVLDEDGKVVSAVATSGPPILRDAAVNAALKARFSPTKLSGQPVKVAGTINYKFSLVP